MTCIWNSEQYKRIATNILKSKRLQMTDVEDNQFVGTSRIRMTEAHILI
jgi:hypothetical protein